MSHVTGDVEHCCWARMECVNGSWSLGRASLLWWKGYQTETLPGENTARTRLTYLAMHTVMESFQPGIIFYILFITLDCASYFYFYFSGDFPLQN